MNAARNRGSASPYPWPVSSRHNATASSTDAPNAPMEPSSSSASSACGRCRTTDQKKATSMRLVASANARLRSSSVDSASSSASRPFWSVPVCSALTPGSLTALAPPPAAGTRRRERSDRSDCRLQGGRKAREPRRRRPPPKLQPPPAAGQESYRPQRSSVPQPSSPLRAGNGLVHPLPLCRDDQLVSLGAVLVVLLDRQPWSVSSSIADRGRPNVSIRRVTISPAARAPAAKASGATWRWVAAAYCVTRTASTTARSVPNTPPRRPNALVPPNSATPRARAVSPTPSMSGFAARSCSAIRTPPRLASADEPRIASVVMPAAPAPRRLAGSRSEEHTSELQSRENLVCRLLLEKKKKKR